MPFSYNTPYTIVSSPTQADYHKPTNAIGYAWHGSAPFAKGNKRFVLTLNVDFSGTPTLLGMACWRSTDQGQTWAEADAGSRPTSATDYYGMPASWCYDETGNGVWISYQNASANLCLIHFDMDAETWGTEQSSGLTLNKMPTSFPVVRANGDVVVVYNNGSAGVAASGFRVYSGGSWSGSTSLGTEFQREVQSGVLHTSSGNIFVVGMNSGGFLYSRCIDPANAVSSAVLLPTGAWPQTGGKIGIDGSNLYFGAEWYADSPLRLKLMTCEGAISGTTVTWSGTLSGLLSNGATPSPQGPGESYSEYRYRNGAFVGPSGAATDGTHLVIPSFINNDPAGFYPGLFYTNLRKFTSTGTTINTGSGTTLHGEENTFFDVAAARLPNGNIGVCFSATDNLVGGRNSTVDDRMIYMELQGAVQSANRWYAI